MKPKLGCTICSNSIRGANLRLIKLCVVANLYAVTVPALTKNLILRLKKNKKEYIHNFVRFYNKL